MAPWPSASRRRRPRTRSRETSRRRWPSRRDPAGERAPGGAVRSSLTCSPDLLKVPRVARGRRASIGGAAIAVALTAFACERREPVAGREPVAERDEEAASKGDARYAAGAFAFGKYCALCHGADAKGYAA